jgi:hypothetical protein
MLIGSVDALRRCPGHNGIARFLTVAPQTTNFLRPRVDVYSRLRLGLTRSGILTRAVKYWIALDVY